MYQIKILIKNARIDNMVKKTGLRIYHKLSCQVGNKLFFNY